MRRQTNASSTQVFGRPQVFVAEPAANFAKPAETRPIANRFRYGRTPADARRARRLCNHRVRRSAVPITRAETAVVTVPNA